MDQVAQLVSVIAGGLVLAVLGGFLLWKQGSRPSVIEVLERSMVSNQSRLDSTQKRLDAQETQIDELRGQIHGLQESRVIDHVLLQEWIAYARNLGDLIRRTTGAEPPPEPAGRPHPLEIRSKVVLARSIDQYFSLEEIRSLAFELGLDGHVSGDTPFVLSESLVNLAARRGLTSQLVELCRKQRPMGPF